jgi:hypothetical protein
MTSMVQLAEDLLEKCRTVPAFAKKSVLVYGVDDLMDAAKNARPAVGVLYEGARSLAESSPSERLGISGEAVFSLIVIAEATVLSQAAEIKAPAHVHLDNLRQAIQGTRAIHGHKWRWVLEAPAVQKNSTAVWVQRWTVPIQVVPAPGASTR